MRAGRDARRRNRNIGTGASGHGRDNRLVIPDPWRERDVFSERLTEYREVTRQVHGERVTFLVGRTRPDRWHACTVDDVTRVLRALPARDQEILELVVLHQPTRKQELLKPVWGRLRYLARIGRHMGPALILEAVPTSGILQRPRRADPDEVRDQQRLRRDGYPVTTDRRHITFHLSLELVRTTQLYHTVAHEVGHWADYSAHVLDGDPVSPTLAERYLEERYWTRPDRDHEEVAYRYAEEARDRLERAGVIPFPRLADPVALLAEGLDPSDFLPPPAPATVGASGGHLPAT